MKSIATLAALAALSLAAAPCAAAPPAHAAYHAPKNSFGQPDFNGVWSLNSLTRLERPSVAPRLVLTEEEASRLRPPQVLPNDSVGTSDTEAHDEFNYDWARLGGEIRSSWLVEPANGRLPYSAGGRALYARRGNNDNPEGRSTYERCLTLPQNGPPILNAAYNNNIRILQTREFAVIQAEANHEVRIVRLTTRQHGPNAQWGGDSIGWYEGETLVVETVNFAAGQSDRRSAMTPVYMSPGARVTERFTRISKDQIKYAFSVDDPAVFTQVWKGEIPLTHTDQPMFEYACHEGNYGLANILSGARYEEAQKAGK